MAISGRGKSYRRFTLKSPSTIYPKLSVRFTPLEITREDLPLKSPSTIYPPPNCPILSKISDTQHHALLHKGLFCERPNRIRPLFSGSIPPLIESNPVLQPFFFLVPPATHGHNKFTCYMPSSHSLASPVTTIIPKIFNSIFPSNKTFFKDMSRDGYLLFISTTTGHDRKEPLAFIFEASVLCSVKQIQIQHIYKW